MNIKTDYYDKSYNYILESVIEYLGGIIIKWHYANLCKAKKNNKWYIFNNSYCDKYNCDFSKKCIFLILIIYLLKYINISRKF